MEPVRTCVGCRQPASKPQLLRVVRVENRLEPDAKATKTGRGAWLHPSSNCLQKAIERRSFSRALKHFEQLDAANLISYIEQAETMLAKNE